MGDEIRRPLIPFRLGDLMDEMIEDAREGFLGFGSSKVRVEGRAFSAFLLGEL
jgi:hypothetical protein